MTIQSHLNPTIVSRRSALKTMTLCLVAAASNLGKTKHPDLPSQRPKNSFSMIEALVEWILPKEGDGPSGIEVGVPQYIELIISEYLPVKESEVFSRGLKNLAIAMNEIVKDQNNNLSSKEDSTILELRIKELVIENAEFVLKFRELALTGYYTSERAAREVFVYDPTPGNYESCILLDTTEGRAWFE